jgi:hypothetical protein
MKAIIAAVLLNAAPMTSRPPLVPLMPLPDPVDESVPLYARSDFWVLLCGSITMTAVFAAVLGFVYFKPAPIPGGRGLE